MEYIVGERNERNLKMIKALKRNGMDSNNRRIGRKCRRSNNNKSALRQCSCKKGYVKNKEEAFSKYISAGKPGYVKRETLTPKNV